MGEIPTFIGNLTKLFMLSLSHNKLKGNIPRSIADCQNLQELDISNNRLSGAIPKEVFALYSLSSLNLSRNSLTGSLPVEIGKLKHTNELDLAENNLTNEIPNAIGGCESMEFLYLQGNLFQGNLPSDLASLRGLQYLDVSRNNFTGTIPKDLEKLRFLMYLNLSFNNLEGEVPSSGVFQNISAISLDGNPKLCGGVANLQLTGCPKKELEHGRTTGLKVEIIIACLTAVLFLLFLGLAVLCCRRKSQRKSSTVETTISCLPTVSYKTLYQATNGFSPSMLIGTGSFGFVYKGILDERENLVAIKVLNLEQKGANKSFVAECNALRNIKHRNLVKVLTCCSSMDYNGNEFKALVFEYMSNGSLDKWLYLTNSDEKQSRGLNIIQRLNIAIDVASTICYLHEDCDPPVIHCDLKPSNVLLDNQMIAHVGDFGLARLISNKAEGQTSTIGIKGTIGYAAPEYAMGGEPSRQGDVYSYGILVLEMFTGKRPTNEMFKDDFNLHNFVKMALPERILQVVDSALLSVVEEMTARREEERNHHKNGDLEVDLEEGNLDFENLNGTSSTLRKCLASVLEIGLACSQDLPNERRSMADVTRELQHVRNACTVGVEIHGEEMENS